MDSQGRGRGRGRRNNNLRGQSQSTGGPRRGIGGTGSGRRPGTNRPGGRYQGRGRAQVSPLGSTSQSLRGISSGSERASDQQLPLPTMMESILSESDMSSAPASDSEVKKGQGPEVTSTPVTSKPQKKTPPRLASSSFRQEGQQPPDPVASGTALAGGTPGSGTPQQQQQSQNFLTIEPTPPIIPQGDHNQPPNEWEMRRNSPISRPHSALSETEGSGSRRTSVADPRVRRISFGLGGVPKSGYWGGLGDGSDSEDSLLAATSRRPSVFLLGPTLLGYNKRQWHILLIFALVDFFSAAVISIQAPIYPALAMEKGANATEWSIVFAAFELTIFIMSPVWAKFVQRIGPANLLKGGVLSSSICVILFGFVAELDETYTFLGFSLTIRILEALGDAACVTAAYAIIAIEFPDSVALTFASLEIFFGLGYIIGPPIGGYLVNLGGFMVPFFVLGTCLLLSSAFTFLIMPSSNDPSGDKDGSGSEEDSSEPQEASSTSKSGKKSSGVLALVEIPTVGLAAFSFLVASMSIGFLNAVLEPHLRDFNLSPPTIGWIFVLNGGFYAVSAPAWGWFCDRVSETNLKFITLLGTVLILLAFLVIGPFPPLGLKSDLGLICGGLILHGLGLGAVYVSGFIFALHDAIDHGFPDNVSTYGLMSALFTSLFAFGNFLGPLVSGPLWDIVGFGWGSSFVLGIQALLGIFIIYFLILGPNGSRRRASGPGTAVQSLLPRVHIEAMTSTEKSGSYYGSTDGGTQR